MRFLDTNILLRYLTRDDEEKAQASLQLLKRVEKNEEKVLTSPLVIFETIFTLQSYYKHPRKEITHLLHLILNVRGLKLEHKETFNKALELYADDTFSHVSFADLYNSCYMALHQVQEIYSYDKDFDRMEGIRRIAPG